jgi:cation transport protein ChaC
MSSPLSRLTLTRDLVERAERHFPVGTKGMVPAHRRHADDDDYRRFIADIRDKAPPGDFWVFAYGSLIWNPDFVAVERRTAMARGWRRSFCLGPDRIFRGSVERPGLMLTLDRGGACRGVVYRLAPERLTADLDRLVRREIRLLPPAFPPRWINVTADSQLIRALTFMVNRQGPAYAGGLTLEEIATCLATASGPMGSMADYLYNTVLHLEQAGLHDGMMWHLQRLVAARIEELTRIS